MKKCALLVDYLNAMDTVGHCDEVTWQWGTRYWKLDV
jgi:hypothetical protein